jgi:hypothetical protein
MSYRLSIYSRKVKPLDSHRIEHQPLYIFLIFLNSSLNFLSVFKVLIRLIQKYLQYSYFFGRRLMCAQTTIFFNEPVSKKCGNYKFYVLGWFMVSPKRVQNMGCAALWWIFSSNKSGPANRKKGFYMIQSSLYLAAQNVELF